MDAMLALAYHGSLNTDAGHVKASVIQYLMFN